MSRVILQDLVDQTITGNNQGTTETNIFVGTISSGLLVNRCLLLENMGRHTNDNQNSRTYTIRLYVGSTGGVGGTLVSTFASVAQTGADASVGFASFQRWELTYIDSDSLSIIERFGFGGHGAAKTLSTSSQADDIIDCVGHGFAIGDAVMFSALTGGNGLSANTAYWVTADSYGTDTFRIAGQPGGASLDFTTDITAGTVRINGSDRGSFGTITTPGGFQTNVVNSLSLDGAIELRMTAQLSHTSVGTGHSYTSRGIYGVLLTETGVGGGGSGQAVIPGPFVRRGRRRIAQVVP